MKRQKKFPFHPLCEIFPVMPDDELNELASDIKENGLRQPIVLLDGKILDGRNRYLACQRADVEPQFKAFKGDALALIASLNIHRRHLNTSQRAMLAAELTGMKPGRPEKGSIVPFVSAGEAAEKLNVSEKSVDRATKVKEQGAAGIKQAVMRGEVAVSKAAAVADLPKREQAAALKAPCGEFSGERMRGHKEEEFYTSTAVAATEYPKTRSVQTMSDEEDKTFDKFVAILTSWRTKPARVISIKLDAKKDANNATVHDFIVAWCEGYKEATKKNYKITGTDTSALKGFLAADEDWKWIIEIAKASWKRNDFHCKLAHSLSSFVRNFGNIRHALDNPNGNSKPTIKPDYSKTGW